MKVKFIGRQPPEGIPLVNGKVYEAEKFGTVYVIETNGKGIPVPAHFIKVVG